jgi:hypothetical protein
MNVKLTGEKKMMDEMENTDKMSHDTRGGDIFTP